MQFGFRMAHDLPGVFVDNPHNQTFNGSIWTLLVEIRLYACVAILGALGVLHRRWLCNLTLLAVFAMALIIPDKVALAAHPDSVRLTLLFALGGLCFVNRTHVPLHAVIVLGLALAAWLLRGTSWYGAAFGLAEVAFVFWFAYDTPSTLFDGMGDYSYGVYLWGFPLQQVVAQVAPTLGPLGNSAFGLGLASVLGMASWHLVEKPALAFKGAPAKTTPAGGWEVEPVVRNLGGPSDVMPLHVPDGASPS